LTGPSTARRAIPTCVGTTRGQRSHSPGGPGHPHVCGDYLQVLRKDNPRSGPSPRVWGLRGHPQRRGERPRAIPTCVGTTSSRQSGMDSTYGPSPRVWGLRARAAQEHGAVRAIPTCVGTTGQRSAAPAPWRAIPTCVGTTRGRSEPWDGEPGHPHVCGDYGFAPLEGEEASGPSPRVWGLHPIVVSVSVGVRAIPTCVGTTSPAPPGRVGGPGHPHVCGDYRVPPASEGGWLGPSPRVWGLPGQDGDGKGVLRAIPTCVGTTAQCLLRRPGRRAIPTCVGTTRSTPCPWKRGAGHPHVCGDY